MMYERINRPADLPLTVEELRTHMRVSYDEGEVERIGKAAAREIEDYGQLALLTQTVRVTFAEVPADTWTVLPIVPVGGSVTATVDGASIGVELASGQRPAVRFAEAVSGAVVEYQAGFGAETADIPEDLALAVADQASALFDQRGGVESGVQALSPHAARIAARYRGVAL